MSIVNKLVKPTVEIIDHIAQKVPKALGHGHHRISQHVHDAADHFDRVEDDLAGKAGKHHPHAPGSHHPGDVSGAGATAAAGAKDGERAGADAARNAGKAGGGGNEGNGGDPVRPGDGDRDSRPPDERHCETDPVDVATGEMMMPAVDVSLPGALPLVLGRTHLSTYRNGLFFGPSWASTLDQRLHLDERGVVYVSADGMRLEYPPPSAASAVLPLRGPRMPLSWSGTPNEPMTVLDPRSGRAMEFDHPRPAPDSPGSVVLRLTAIEDRNGRRIDVTWSANGLPSLVTHHGGYRVAVDHHPTLPRITGFRLLGTDAPGPADDPAAAPGDGADTGGGTPLARYGYDAAGNLTEIVNSSGLPLRLTYDDRRRVTSWTDRTGTSYHYDYDAAGRVVATRGSDGILSGSFAYDDRTHTTRFTDSLGHTTVHEHNDAYRLVRSTDPLGSVTLQEWSQDNRLMVSATDPLGRTTRFEHDAAGNILAVVQPDGGRITFAYHGSGLPVRMTDQAGRVWRTEYDSRGNRVATVDPQGARTEYVHDDAGNLTAVVDALGGTTLMTSDAAGLPIAVTDPLGGVTTAVRDAFGRIVESTDPLGGTVRVGWTTEGLVTWCERADGRREEWSFDAEGNCVAHTAPDGTVSRLEPAHFDLVAAGTEPDGSAFAFAYDTEKRLTRVTSPLGRSWQYAYDAAGRLVEETDFDGRSLEYAYDAAGQLVARTNGAGETVTLTRDILGRVVAQSDGEQTTTFEYDAAGDLARSVNAGVEVVREHDLMGRVLSETVDGRRIAYRYDLLGRRVWRRTPSGVESTWSYDAGGLPELLRLAGHRTAFSFDALRRESARRLDDAVTLAQHWDATGRLTRRGVVHEPSGAAGPARPVLERRFSYRADDLLTEVRDLASGVRRLGLDQAGRVTSVTAEGWTERYAYDALGNVTQAATPLDEPGGGAREFDGTRVRRAGRTRYEYDAQGRTVRTVTRLLNGQQHVRSFSWNAYDQLVSAVTPDGQRWRYRHDAAGRRVAKERLDAAGAVAEEVRFTWDLVCLAEQATGAGATTTWEYVPGGHTPLAQVDGGHDQDDTDRRFHAIVTDLVGSPTELLTPDGQIAWRRRATLWGSGEQDGTGPGTGQGGGGQDGRPGCPLRFPGQYADRETGWHYNYFRYYDPATGRYTSPDPLGLTPAPNPAAYVPNPTAQVDPLGLAYKPNLPGWNKEEPIDPTWGGRVVYGPLDMHGRPTGVTARVQSDMLGQSTDPQIAFNRMPGWDGQASYNRTHLLAASLGGSNNMPENFVTAHRYANHPVMYHYESQVARAAGAHPHIDYSVTPVYRYSGIGPMRPEDLRPIGMMIEAHSPDGTFSFTPYNTRGADRQELHYGEDGNLDRVFVLNVPKCQ
ncbi:DUF6531 domain-containing protein [Streptomyces sp. V4-01]|uniref:DUF6531 domain-containing protein n=1 Tax=Actinacidiphila polyblastidii TaxID=3110430 RepID=A0ABU7P3S7_9ACTN|nr:DUF6531 domain-containing protein [Streptomyces sp. V4-01]